MANQMNNLCKCPFCFKPFAPDAVHFKTETVVDQAYIDAADLPEEEEEKLKMYLSKPDEKYNTFWSQYGGAPQGSDDGTPSYWNEYYNHAVIGFVGSEFEQNKPQQGLRDESGFLYGAVDSMNKPTKIRVCPHCHNPLPHEYGKYPVKFVSVVGITSSGKTVYLSQLLSRINEFLARANLTIVGMHNEIDDFVREHRIAKNKELPKGNSKHTLTLPLPMNVKDNITGNTFTMIFYDIAGENCVDPDQMEKYGKFIENANGIVMIVDPKQFSDLFTSLNDAPLQAYDDESDEDEDEDDDFYDEDEEDDFDEEEYEEIERPERVVQAMYNAFASRSAGGRSSIPLAVAVSKSDLIQNYFRNSDMHMFHNIDYSSYDRMGFPKNDFYNIDSEVRSVLSGMRMRKESMQGKLLCDQLKQNFEKHAFFAVSAVYNASIIKKRRKKTGDIILTVQSSPDTLRVEEPILWLLYEMGLVREANIKTADPRRNDGRNGGKPLRRRLFG